MIKEFSFTFASGNKFTGYIHAYGGEVLDTDQRSDTYVHGSGSSMIYKGSGGGSTNISSSVVVNRDIWLKDIEGKEIHVRLNLDLPIRKGQIVYLFDFDTGKKRWTPLLYNYSTKEKFILKKEATFEFFTDFSWGRYFRIFLSAVFKFMLALLIPVFISILMGYQTPADSGGLLPVLFTAYSAWLFYRLFIKKLWTEAKKSYGEIGAEKPQNELVEELVNEIILKIENKPTTNKPES